MFAVCETYASEPDSVETNVSLMGQSLPANHEKKPMESGLTSRAGRYIDPGDHRYSSLVAGLSVAVEILRISGQEMGPYFPRAGRNCPPSVGGPLSSILIQGCVTAVELEPVSDSSK